MYSKQFGYIFFVNFKNLLQKNSIILKMGEQIMNKKLIKTIASITCGLGIVGLISITSTSCNNHS